MDGFKFPDGFSLGVASAATQIDGDCKNSNWYDWYRRGKIKDGSDPDTSTLHRKYLREDTELLASMGIRHYRFGLEWARIEPEDGEFSEEELEKVRVELRLLREHGIAPLVTLHHFSNPMWFEERGGFLSPDHLAVFLRYVEKVVRGLGGLASEYITINEPNVYAMNGYISGSFPPGQQSISKGLKVMKNMGACHREAYRLIHRVRNELGFEDTAVSFAHHMRVFTPYDVRKSRDRVSAWLSEYLFQGRISRTYLLGERGDRGVFADFLAVNYYTRTASAGLADGVFKDVPVNDLGWEIYPEGIVRCCVQLHELLPELPIYITENGTADNDDSFRKRYIYEHLKALCGSGLPVTRYYHWCFVDNFEWLEGFSARFGIVGLDTATMERRIKDSGRFYSRMIENGGVTEALAAEALAGSYRTDMPPRRL